MKLSLTRRGPAWLGLLAKGLAGLVAAGLLASVALPLIIRGPRFASVVKGLLPPMQGTLEFEGGRVGVGALWALVFGRPVPLLLEGLVIKDPEGVEVFRSQRLLTRVELRREPLRVMLHDLRPGKSTWRFSRMKKERRIGFLAAFSRPPAPPPPPAPAPVPATPPTPPGPPAPKFTAEFGIASAQLDGLTAIFDFPNWGLELADIKATGFLRVDVNKGRPPITFIAQRVDARKGGFLRILGGDRATVIPFDRARLEQVGTSSERLADLELLVSAGMTGDSRLHGTATFPNLFPGRAPGSQRGVVVDATWERAGAGLTAALASRGLRDLAIAGEKAHLRAQVKSSFRDIEGSFATAGLDLSYRGFRLSDLGFDVSIAGPPLRMTLDRLRFGGPAGGKVEGSAALDREGEMRFDLRVEQLGTEAMLPPSLRPLLAGRADGSLALRGNLRERSAIVDQIDVLLDRDRRGPLPRRFRIVSLDSPVKRAPFGDDQFLIRLGKTELARGVLAASQLEATAFGARMRAHPLALTLYGPDGHALAAPGVDLGLSVGNLDLAQVFPGAGLRGVISFSSRVRGSFDALDARVRFPARAASVTVFDQDYRFPAEARFAVAGGDELQVQSLVLGAPGGGTLKVAGRVIADRELDLSVSADAHRLDRVPFLSAALPSLGGRMGGKLHVFGAPLLPQLEGQMELSQVTLKGVALGQGTLRMTTAGPGRSTFRGAMFEQLKLAGDLRVGEGGPALAATIDADGLALDPFLAQVAPAPLRDGRLRIGGRLTLAAQPGRALEVGAALEKVQFGYGCRSRATDPHAAGCFVLESRGPLRARSQAGLRTIEVERARFVGPGSDFAVAGKLNAGSVDAEVKGRVGLACLRPFLEGAYMEASGALDTNLVARGPLGDPTVSGSFEVVEPVWVQSRFPRVDLRVPRGQVAFARGRVKSPGLEVEALGMKLGLRGEGPMPLAIAGDRGMPAANEPLDLSVDGSVDAGLLPRILPGYLAAAQGRVAVKGRVSGTLADPHIDGQATLGKLALDLRPRRSDPKHVHIDVLGGNVSARGDQVRLEQVAARLSPGGEVTVGPPGRAAEVQLLSLAPPAVGRVSLPFVGRGLHVDLGWLRLEDGALDMRLEGDAARGPIALTGDVQIDAGRVRPGRAPRAAPAPLPPRPPGAPPARPGPAGPPPIKLDVRVRSDGDRFVIDPGWLPDLHLDFDVRVGGTLSKPAVAWDAKSKGIYSAIALWLFRLFS